MSDLLDVAQRAVELAKKCGAKDASATASRDRDVELGWRDGKTEKVSEATTRGLSIQLYVDGRYSSVSTSDLRPEALERFIADSVAMARALAVDPHRGLPDPKLYEGRSNASLDNFDPSQATMTPETRRDVAKRLEDASRAVDGAGAIVSVSTGISDGHSRWARVSSNGFSGEDQRTSFSIWSSVTAKDTTGRRPEDWAAGTSPHFAKLPDVSAIGKEASLRALGTLGSKKVESSVTTVIVENRAAGRVLGAMLGALTGRALQQKQSFLDGQLGKQVASKLLTVIDEPLLAGGLGSRRWDGDGISTKRRPIIEAGVLKTYLIDVYYGRKLNQAPTTGSTSNVLFTLGKKPLDGLIADAKDAILITGFLGGNSNGTTGDYSFGIHGFRVRGGKRAEPIAEMNIAGNLKDLWKKLVAVGSDPYLASAMQTPTLVFEGVSVAGL